MINKNNIKIPLDKFISKTLYDKDKGFYMKKFPFGKDGDFITSPEISVLFSEMISIWLISFWENLNKPKKLNIIELGAGSGEMMLQIIKTLKNFSEVNLSTNFFILEKSPLLIKNQKRKIKDQKVKWIKKLSNIPKCPTIFLANEFFDAFPIKQYIKKNGNWHERYVSLNKNKYEIYNQKVSINDVKKNFEEKIIKQNFIEVSPLAMKLVDKISKIIFKQNGGLLMIDYGFTNGIMNDTLQSVAKHKKTSFLINPYNSDTTHLINFKLFKNRFSKNKLSSLITKQGSFLIKLGILRRAELITQNLKFSKKADIFYRVKRLIDERHMGSLFKVLFTRKIKNNFDLGFK
tara:strand:- start:1658 stop:2698 length:1041 start_codon:yes stop_codon:yes gene_type:complete